MSSLLIRKLADLEIENAQEYVKELLNDPRSWAIASAAISSYYLVNYYWQKGSYPPGPTPFPLVGNILSFKGKTHPHEVIKDWRKKYGDVVTVYFGPVPNVVIFDLELARQAFGHKDFAGRPHFSISEAFLGPNGIDLIIADYGRTWEVLRRVTFAAIRKYASGDKLPVLVADVVDEVVEIIKKTEAEKPFNMMEYIYLMVYNILAQSAYGKRYSIKDPEFIKLKEENDEQNALSTNLLLAELIPLTRHTIYRRTWKRFEQLQIGFREFLSAKYQDHLKDFDGDNIRDFADALIFAKEEAILENSDAAEHLNDNNLALVLMDLFAAGTDTTRITFAWAVLLMAEHLEIQKKLRNEIDEVLGDSQLGQDRRNDFNYCQAFLSEVLRFRNVVPLGVLHKATADTKIGSHKIPKGTLVHVHQESIMNDPKYWDKPEQFNPNRFLDQEGRHNSRLHQAFIPFSLGRRACPGEKLALADLLFILVRFMQATKGHMLELENGPGSIDLGGKSEGNILFPVNYNIIMKKYP